MIIVSIIQVNTHIIYIYDIYIYIYLKVNGF